MAKRFITATQPACTCGRADRTALWVRLEVCDAIFLDLLVRFRLVRCARTRGGVCRVALPIRGTGSRSIFRGGDRFPQGFRSRDRRNSLRVRVSVGPE